MALPSSGKSWGWDTGMSSGSFKSNAANLHQIRLYVQSLKDARHKLMSEYDILSNAAPSLTPKERGFLHRASIYQEQYQIRSKAHSWMLCEHGKWLFEPCRHRKCRRSEVDAEKYITIIANALRGLVE